MFAKIGRALEHFFFSSSDSRSLAALRIGLFALLAGRLINNSERYFQALEQPPALFDPVSLFHLLPAMPASPLVAVILVVTVLAAGSAVIGIIPRISFPVAWGGAVFLGLILNASGKIIHNDVLLLLVLIPLLFQPRAAVRSWSFYSWRRQLTPEKSWRARWVGATAMTIVALSYLFAGWQKLRFSGLEWVTSDNLRFILLDSGVDNWLNQALVNSGLFIHLLAGGALFLELAFILCLPLVILRWIFIPAIVSLHLFIYLTLGINYLPQAAVVLIVFLPWLQIAQVFFSARVLEKPSPATVFYDLDCGVCQKIINYFLRWDQGNILRAVPIQSPEGQQALENIPPDKRLDSWHLQDDQGQVYSAGAVFPEIFSRVLWGQPLALLSAQFPKTTNRCYFFFSRRRHYLARVLGEEACQLPAIARERPVVTEPKG